MKPGGAYSDHWDLGLIKAVIITKFAIKCISLEHDGTFNG